MISAFREQDVERLIDGERTGAEPYREAPATAAVSRPHPVRRRALVALTVPVIALVATMGAVAFWTSGGTGTASAAVGTLTAPTNVAGVQSGADVNVSWTAGSVGGAGPVSYHVERRDDSGSVWTSVCGSSPTPITGVSCADLAVPAGGYRYRVTSIFHSWTAVSAASGKVTVTTLDHFDVTPATGTLTAGTPFTVTVTAKDASNATVTGYTGTIAFTSNDGLAVLPANYIFTGADAGVHTFTTGVTLKTAGNGKTVTVTGSGKTGTATYTVDPAALDHFAFAAASPQTNAVAFTGPNTLTAQDLYNNTVTTFNASANNVTITALSPLTGTVSGIHASNVLNLAGDFSSGVANLTALGMTYTGNAASGTFRATSANGKIGTSGTVAVAVGAAARVKFTLQPGNGTGGSNLVTQPVVTVQDAGGNTVAGSSATVTLAIGTNPGSGVLSCTANPKAAVAGVATFAGCKIDKVGTGYTLTASASGLTGDTSSAFNITLGPAAKVKFTTQPGNGTGGSNLATQPKVTVQDAGGNTRTADTTSVTLAIGTNPGSGVLSCTANPKAAVAGVATFAGCRIDKVGTGYTLTASASGLTGDTSSAFNITLGPAARVKFTTQPGNGTGGSNLVTQPEVTVQDAGGNTRTADTTSITLAIGTNPGSGVLSCTANPKAAVAGVATFAGCRIDKVGTGYTLTASASGLTGDTSSAFNITLGPAAKVKLTTQPGNGTGGSNLGRSRL